MISLRRPVLVLLLLLFIAPMVANIDISPGGPAGTREQTVYIVASDGTGDHDTIQDAIWDCWGGEKILIREGIYYEEEVQVTASVEIKGAGMGKTIIDGRLSIAADGVILDGLTVKRGEWQTAFQVLSNNNRIRNVSFEAEDYGLEVEDSSGNHIEHCSFVDCRTGLHLSRCENTFVNDNYFHNSTFSTYNSNHTTLRKNTFEDCGFGFYADHLDQVSTFSVDESNLLDGKPVPFFVNQRNLTVNDHDDLIVLLNCSDVKINNLNGSLLSSFSSNVTVTNSQIEEQNFFYIENTGQLHLKNNTFSKKGPDWGYGLWVNGLLKDCTFESNKFINKGVTGDHFLNLKNSDVLNNQFINSFNFISFNECRVKNNMFELGTQVFDFNGVSEFEDNRFDQTGPQFDLSGYYDRFTAPRFRISDSNTVNNKPILCHFKEQDLQVKDGAGMVVLIDCQNITVKDQIFSNTSFGISLINSSGCKIINNQISFSEYGVQCYEDCDNNLFENNNCSNSHIGMNLRTYGTFNNNMIRNNVCSHNDYGITYWGSDGILANNSFIDNSETGLSIRSNYGRTEAHCINNSISDNLAVGNKEYGIKLDNPYVYDANTGSASALAFVRNTCSENRYGLMLLGEDLLINGNNCSGNNYTGIGISGLYDADSLIRVVNNRCDNNGEDGIWSNGNGMILDSNTASGNHRHGLNVDSDDAVVRNNLCKNNNYSGILILGSRIIAKENTCSNNKFGLISWDLDHSLIEDNRFSYNQLGIQLDNRISDNNIRSNLFVENDGYGIAFNRVTEYREPGAGWEYIISYSTSGNNITGNILLFNNDTSCQAFDDSPENNWDISGRGNFWSDHLGPDKDNDGIVDTPYLIEGEYGVKDNDPLTIPDNLDEDSDGIYDVFELMAAIEQNTTSISFSDQDTDSIPDVYDWDRDGDGVGNSDDKYPDDPDRSDDTVLIIVAVVLAVLFIASIVAMMLYKTKKAEQKEIEMVNGEVPP